MTKLKIPSRIFHAPLQTLGCGMLLCAAFTAASAQTLGSQPAPTAAPAASGPLPEFEVVSVKLNKSGSTNSMIRSKPDGYTDTNVLLMFLLENAYNMRDEQIFGAPAWAKSEHFDMETKVAGPDVEQYKKLNNAQRRTMIQGVLADRFKLKAHIETKELPVYELVLAKGGSTMPEETTPTPPPPDGGPTPRTMNAMTLSSGNMMVGRDELEAKGVPVSTLTATLATLVHRAVVDKTGLTGKYDMKLKWAAEDGSAAANDEVGPSIFTAVQEQLGLKLQPSKGPVDILVIDHVEMPTDN